MGANSNRKGKRGERRVVNRYKAIDLNADREDAILESGKNSRKRQGETGSDVNVYVDIGHGAEKLALAIQVRDQANPSVWVAVSDAERPAKKRWHIPIAHVKRTQRKPGTKAERLVVMNEDAWLSILYALVSELGGWELEKFFQDAAAIYHTGLPDAGKGE